MGFAHPLKLRTDKHCKYTLFAQHASTEAT